MRMDFKSSGDTPHGHNRAFGCFFGYGLLAVTDFLASAYVGWPAVFCATLLLALVQQRLWPRKPSEGGMTFGEEVSEYFKKHEGELGCAGCWTWFAVGTIFLTPAAFFGLAVVFQDDPLAKRLLLTMSATTVFRCLGPGLFLGVRRK